MLIDEDIKNIIFTPGEPQSSWQLNVIERFIYDKKGVEVKINIPDRNDTRNLQLMTMAYEIAKQYYSGVLK